jgi:cytochrome c oxidase subunit 3
MKPQLRLARDVGGLPHEVFGPQNITWWGAMGGEVIEGFVLVIGIFAYYYLAHHSPNWPPLHTPLPSLGPSFANFGVMALSVAAAWWAAHSARRRDRNATAWALASHSVLAIAILVIRYFECKALHVRWDTDAYGSITWALLFSHGYIALFDVLDTVGLLVLFLRLEPEEKHYVDVDDNSFFWYFVIASWIPVFATVFLGPRF